MSSHSAQINAAYSSEEFDSYIVEDYNEEEVFQIRENLSKYLIIDDSVFNAIPVLEKIDWTNIPPVKIDSLEKYQKHQEQLKKSAEEKEGKIDWTNIPPVKIDSLEKYQKHQEQLKKSAEEKEGKIDWTNIPPVKIDSCEKYQKHQEQLQDLQH